MKSFSFQLNRRGLITLLMAMLFALPAFSQKMAVQGTVIDENGEPIIGASVVDSKTKAGTATDFDGNFVLNVDKNAVLQVTYVGYKTQNVNVDGRNKLTVKLQTNSVVLNEVVAIGYGTVKKRRRHWRHLYFETGRNRSRSCNFRTRPPRWSRSWCGCHIKRWPAWKAALQSVSVVVLL